MYVLRPTKLPTYGYVQLTQVLIFYKKNPKYN
jgi:hypothetical protein